jgi:hypothetical protein
MDLSNYIKKAFSYDKAGNFKQADILTDMVRTSQQIQGLFPTKSYEYEGANPYIQSSLDPTSMQGTLGYDLAGDIKAPGGFLSDTSPNINGPLVFENLTPEKKKYFHDNPKEWLKYQNKIRAKQGLLQAELADGGTKLEANLIRKIFTSSEVPDDPKLKRLLDSQMGMLESNIKNQIRLKLNTPQAIKQSFINLINRAPEYNNHPKLKQYLISRINNIQ